MILSVFIPGEPRGKGRPRFTRYGHTYTDEKTKLFERHVLECFRRQYPGFKPIEKDHAISVVIEARFGIPRSVSKKKRAEMLQGIIRPTKVPDADNIAKAVMDSVLKHCYVDDSSVVDLAVTKVYSEEPGILFVVRDAAGE